MPDGRDLVDVIITTDPEKLPAQIRALQDPARPLPIGAQFFEQRFTFMGLLQNVTIGALLAIMALIAFMFFIALLVESFGPTTVAYSQYDSKVEFGALAFSGVFGFGSYLMLSSVIPIASLAWSGQHTRYGLVLLGEWLVSHSMFDTTVIPRDKLTGVAAGKVGYLLGQAHKSLTLPNIVDGQLPLLIAAIERWKASG
jgi:hypothetical protein